MSNLISTHAATARRAAALIAGAAALALLTGCSVGSGPSGGDGGGGSDSDGSTWADIEERGVINIGVGLTTPPYGQTDKNGDPAGYDVAMAQDLADYLGVEANIFEVTADGRIPTIQSGKADVISFTLTQTPERDEQIDFSSATMNTYQAAAVRVDSPITSIDELGDKTIAAQKGALGATVAAKTYPTATLQQYDTAVSVHLAVSQGQADAVVDSVSVLQYAIASDPDMKLKVLPGVIGEELQHYGLGIQDGNTTLKEKLDEFLADFHSKGKGKELYKEWFGSEAPDDVFKGLED